MDVGLAHVSGDNVGSHAVNGGDGRCDNWTRESVAVNEQEDMVVGSVGCKTETINRDFVAAEWTGERVSDAEHLDRNFDGRVGGSRGGGPGSVAFAGGSNNQSIYSSGDSLDGASDAGVSEGGNRKLEQFDPIAVGKPYTDSGVISSETSTSDGDGRRISGGSDSEGVTTNTDDIRGAAI